jgi:hypothetical protein
MAGADLILLPSIYPVAPETMQPTARPMMMDMFFMNGDPNISVSIIVTKDKKPSPMNSGEPHLHSGNTYEFKQTATIFIGSLTGEAEAQRYRGTMQRTRTKAC